MSNPFITVAITCFNAEDSIERAIRSALNQGYPYFEALVVDDCSEDGSVQIVEGMCAKDNRLRLVRHQNNTGPGGARATLLREARGELIAFFDDDDESMPDRLSVQFARIFSYEQEAGQKTIACYASGKRVYPNGYTLEIEAIGSRPDVPVGEAVADYLLFYGKHDGVFYGAGTPTCALMARRDVLLSVGGFDPAFRRVEDVDLAVRLARAGCHFIGCPERLYIQYATQAPDKSALRNYEAELSLLEKNRGYLETKGRYGYARNWLLFRYFHFAGKKLKAVAVLIYALIQNPVLVSRHLLETGPKRFLHERKMRAEVELER